MKKLLGANQGIMNLGSTCYLNVTIQLLKATTIKTFNQSPLSIEIGTALSALEVAEQSFYPETLHEELSLYRSIYKNPHKQQDAHECFLDILESTGIDREIARHYCLIPAEKVEFDITYQLEKLEQTLIDKKLFYTMLPRYDYRQRNWGTEMIKIENKIKYPREVKNFRLKGIVEHIGSSLKAGHYIAYIRTDSDFWFRYNDEHVERINSSDILLFEKTAYILLYSAI